MSGGLSSAPSGALATAARRAAPDVQSSLIMAASIDLFHCNLPWVPDQIVRDTSFEQRQRQVWLTDARLCSVARDIGGKRDRSYADPYLGRRVALMPQAMVVGFGGKALVCLSAFGPEQVATDALSLSIANHRPARRSWAASAKAVLASRSDRSQN